MLNLSKQAIVAKWSLHLATSVSSLGVPLQLMAVDKCLTAYRIVTALIAGCIYNTVERVSRTAHFSLAEKTGHPGEYRTVGNPT